MKKQYIYKITYPNGKIYVGQDVTESYATYFGSGNKEYIQQDFSFEQFKCFTVTKEILWSGEGFTPAALTRKEYDLIVGNEANNPEKGYNLRPEFTGKQ
jgi:hypothetical protein